MGPTKRSNSIHLALRSKIILTVRRRFTKPCHGGLLNRRRVRFKFNIHTSRYTNNTRRSKEGTTRTYSNTKKATSRVLRSFSTIRHRYHRVRLVGRRSYLLPFRIRIQDSNRIQTSNARVPQMFQSIIRNLLRSQMCPRIANRRAGRNVKEVVSRSHLTVPMQRRRLQPFIRVRLQLGRQRAL